MAIGQKQIYNNPENYAQFEAWKKRIEEEDTCEVVEAFKEHSQSNYEGEFLNGYDVSRNILMYAACHANVNLVKYIVENADPRIINMRDCIGCTALHRVVVDAAFDLPAHKVIQCAQILIQAGADINTRWRFRKPISKADLPLPEAALDENNFCGNNPLGYLTWKLLDGNLSPKSKETHELMTSLFLASGARGHYYINKLETGWFNIEDAVDENDTSERAKRVKVLRGVQEKYSDWPKTRLLFLGNKDPNSSLSHLPSELIQLIFQKRALLNFEKE